MGFSGVTVDQSDDGFNIPQLQYIDRFKAFQSDANFVLIKQYLAKLS